MIRTGTTENCMKNVNNSSRATVGRGTRNNRANIILRAHAVHIFRRSRTMCTVAINEHCTGARIVVDCRLYGAHLRHYVVTIQRLHIILHTRNALSLAARVRFRASRTKPFGRPKNPR